MIDWALLVIIVLSLGSVRFARGLAKLLLTHAQAWEDARRAYAAGWSAYIRRREAAKRIVEEPCTT